MVTREETGSVVGVLDQAALLAQLDQRLSQQPGMTEAEAFNRAIETAHERARAGDDPNLSLNRRDKMTYISSIERDAKREARQEEIESLLTAKFGELDAELTATIAPLMALSVSDRARLTLQIVQMSREELIAQFQPPNK